MKYYPDALDVSRLPNRLVLDVTRFLDLPLARDIEYVHEDRRGNWRGCIKVIFAVACGIKRLRKYHQYKPYSREVERLIDIALHESPEKYKMPPANSKYPWEQKYPDLCNLLYLYEARLQVLYSSTKKERLALKFDLLTALAERELVQFTNIPPDLNLGLRYGMTVELDDPRTDELPDYYREALIPEI